MGYFKKTILPIFLVGLWINISETIRWLFLIKAYWIEHYQNLNLILPDEPVNGITWMIWGFLYASMMFILSKKFNILQTALLSWFIAFVLMWIVVWNIGVLPTGMLWINAPLSFIEAYIAAFIYKRLL